MGGMKAAILFQSLSGNTRRAGELIAANLQQEGWGITTVAPMKQLEMSAIQSADMVIIGTWVHGLFVVGQAPWGIGAINHLLTPISGRLRVRTHILELAAALTIEAAHAAGLAGIGVEADRSLVLNAEEVAARLVANVPARA